MLVGKNLLIPRQKNLIVSIDLEFLEAAVHRIFEADK